MLLLKHFSISFKGDAKLSALFMPEELWESVAKSAKDKCCDPHVLPTEILKLGGHPLASFIALVLDGIQSSSEVDHKEFGFQARGILLYKDEPGNSKSNVTHYQLLLLLDSNTHVIHSATESSSLEC